ncbi:MAG TPA: metal-dependent hydrolase [Pseudomonadales bacterium]
MDPFSQAALGAVVGQAAGHARLGYRAATVGALAGAMPDLDVLLAIGGDAFDQLVVHRGITHSLFFAPVAGPILGLLMWRWERRRAAANPPDTARRAAWILVVTLALLSHPLLDYLTPYGTQLLLPFSNARFAIDAMPIIDPVYTLLLAVGLVIAARWQRARAPQVALATLLVSCAYLAWGGWLNVAAEREAERQLAAIGLQDARVAAFPTVLQIHYRRVVARTPERDLVGFVSMWRPCAIDWQGAPRLGRDHPLVRRFLTTREGRIFDWFTMGWSRYRVEHADGHRWLHASDLRYGFTPDPDRSIFNVRVRVLPHGELAGVMEPGRDTTEATGQRLRQLVLHAYAPDCSSGTTARIGGSAVGAGQ